MIFIYYRLNMKKKATHHYAHVAHAMHHHRAASHLPKVFYNKGSLFPHLFWKVSFLALLCGFMGYFLVHNLAPQTVRNTSSDQKMIFSFDGKAQDWWVDPASLNTHGAASNEFDFLFSDTWTNDASVNTTPIVVSSWTVVHSWITNIPNNSVIDSSSDVGPKTPASPVKTPVVDNWVACVTPWWDKIQSQDFVLAYQQRTDVNSLCNLQKRTCVNGKLSGSYTQQSCKENLKYEYTDITPVAVNDPNKVDPFIQPSGARLSGAAFDNHGKINTTTAPIDTWSNASWSVKTNTGDYVTHLSTPNTSSCITPWWAAVRLGQFVKAYKSPVWLIDMPCEVQIRLCTSDGLKWTFKQASCTYRNQTYSDYILNKWEDTNTPNVIDMMNTTSTQAQKTASTSAGFWTRVSKYF